MVSCASCTMQTVLYNGFQENNATSRVATMPAPLSAEGHLCIGVYLLFLGVLAFAGNITVLLVILSQKSALRKMQNALLVNMAAADLLVTLTSYPLTAVSSFYERWLFGDLACRVGGFLVFMLTMVSLDTLTFIAIFRYILVCKPKYHHLLRIESVRPVLMTCWVHSTVWAALPMLGWSSYTQEPFLTACSIDWATPTFSNSTYVVLTILSCYIVHLVTVFFCYWHILRRSRSLTFGARKDSNLVNLEEVLWHHKVETERGVTKMCAVMVTAFLVCWSPYALISSLSMVGVRLSTQVTTLPTMFAKLSCALNPIIYAFMSSKFRERLLYMVPWTQHGQNRVATSTSTIELPGSPPFRGIKVLEMKWRSLDDKRSLTLMVVCGLVAPSGVPTLIYRNDLYILGVTKTCCSNRATLRNQHHDPVLVREYRGDMTNQGVYIGNMVVTLEVQSSVF